MALLKSQRRCPWCAGVVCAKPGSHAATVEAMLARHIESCPGAPAPKVKPPTTPDEMMGALGSALVIDKGRAQPRKRNR